MPDAAEVYRPVGEGAELSSGDIAFLSLARTRVVGEAPPGAVFDPIGRIPAYPQPAIFPLPHQREIALDGMFGLVVTHSCEIDRQKNVGVSEDHFDCRLTVAPIVPEPAVSLVRAGQTASDAEDAFSWASIEANAPVASLFLPPIADSREFAPELPAAVAWPRAFADLRGLATVSRRMVAADRLFGLTPSYVVVLQRQLARFFTWRDLARHEAVEALVGRRIVGVVPLNKSAERVRVALTADDGTSISVEMRTK